MAWRAEITEISCSVERPPKKTPTVVFIIFCDKLYIWFVIMIEIYLNVSGRSFS